jgi:xylulokinase
MNCTVSTDLMRAWLGADITEFETRISRAPRGADGAITVPFFNGERTPNLPDAKGCIVGLDSGNMQPDQLLRSAVEGATYGLRFGIDEMRDLGIHATEIILTGGGVKSATWRQVVADICNVPVTVLAQDEGAAFGAALQALELLDDSANLPALAEQHLRRDESRCCEPREASVNFYAAAYRQYQKAVSAIAALYGD